MHSSRVRRIDPISAEGRAIITRGKAKTGLLDVCAAAKDALDNKPKLAFGQVEEPGFLVQRRFDSNRLSEITDFKKWLSLFFVLKGSYNITETAIDNFGNIEKARQYLEFAEHSSSREREERIEMRYKPSKRQKKELAERVICKLIDEGKAEELVTAGHITKPKKISWKDKQTRVAVVKRLVELSGKPAADLCRDDFKAVGLGGLSKHYEDSPYFSLVEADLAYSPAQISAFSAKSVFPAEKVYPWQMRVRIYGDVEIRIAAVKWLIYTLKKNPKELTTYDFQDNGLNGLLCNYYGSSQYKALVEADLAYSLEDIKQFSVQKKFPKAKIYPWELEKSPHIYHDKIIRVAATLWLVQTLDKKPTDISYDDISKNFPGLLHNIPQQSVYLALSEADLAYSIEEITGFSDANTFPKTKIYPWNMKEQPSVYGDKTIRVAATRWLISTTGKKPTSLVGDDFIKYGVAAVLTTLPTESPYLALVEAELGYSFDEIRSFSEKRNFPCEKNYPWEMSRTPTIYSDRSIRIAAIRWLIQLTGKNHTALDRQDFIKNGLEGLFTHYNDPVKFESELHSING